MVALYTTVLALVLLISSCLSQRAKRQESPDGMGFTAGPNGPPPPTEAASKKDLEEFQKARGLETRQESPDGGGFTAGPDGPPPPDKKDLEAFLQARDEGLEERAEGDWKTRMGKKCISGGSGLGYQGCQLYPDGSQFGGFEVLWCKTGSGEDDWESCCSHSCVWYKPWWGDGYNYCYVNKNPSTRWDYCKSGDWGGK